MFYNFINIIIKNKLLNMIIKIYWFILHPVVLHTRNFKDIFYFIVKKFELSSFINSKIDD